MAAQTKHICFKQPFNKKIKLWRYLSFAKFVSLIDTSKLFLARVDRLIDPFEGAVSNVNRKMQTDIYNGLNEKQIKSISEFHKHARSWTYINWWHMNDVESDAMWKLYTNNSSEAVVIQTTYSKLTANLSDQLFLGMVNYYDPDRDVVPVGNIFFPFMYKRNSFEHEKEVRILKPGFMGKNVKQMAEETNNEYDHFEHIDLNKIIEKIIITPSAQNWFYETVNSIINKYNLQIDINKSKFDEAPVY